MILRKPYAFLIKNFRIIHFFIITCIMYVMFKTWNILSFFNQYIANGQVLNTIEDITGNYIDSLLIFFISFIIIGSSIIFYLMRHKKKPVFFYVFMFISYLLILILTLFASSFIYDIQFSTPDLRITKLVRDIYLGAFVIQLPSLIVCFIRVIGFDIKKFDFKKDLLELDISAEDNEEFEFELNLDTEDIKAKVRKRIRYFRYYFKENKVVFFCIFSVIGVIGIVYTINFVTSIEKIYKEGEIFNTRLLEVSVTDSYKTMTDYKGTNIKNKNYYLILKIKYKNKSQTSLQINLENARVNYNEYNGVTPTKMVYDKFSEFGVPYYNQTLKPNEIKDFVLVYEIDKKYYNSELNLKYLYDVEMVNSQPEYKYRVVNLTPETFDETKLIDTKTLNEELVFKNSLLKDTKIIIKNIEFNNKYSYIVNYCKSGTCQKSTNFLMPSTNGAYDLTLMRINYELYYDSTLGKEFSISNFIAKYGSIRFVINGKEYEHKINLKDITPYPTDEYAYLEVRKKIIDAEKIYLDFTIRDKKYTYVIREPEKTENGEITQKETINNE